MRTLALTLILLVSPCLASTQDLDLFTRRCRAGELPSCNVAGLMLETGAAGDPDLARALDLYRLACAGGDAVGCTAVGLLYQKGRGVERDRDVAASQYRMACDGGGRMACDLLSDLEAEGPVRERRPFYTGGRVFDNDTGEPLEGVLVDLSTLGLQELSGTDGAVALGRVPEGTYELRAEVLGYEAVAGVLNVPGYSEFVLLLDRIDGLEARRPGRLWGTVTDARGRGVRDASVVIVGREETRASTGPQGRFAFPGLEAGLVEMRVTAPGGDEASKLLVVQPGRTARVDARLTEDGIELERPPS